MWSFLLYTHHTTQHNNTHLESLVCAAVLKVIKTLISTVRATTVCLAFGLVGVSRHLQVGRIPVLDRLYRVVPHGLVPPATAPVERRLKTTSVSSHFRHHFFIPTTCYYTPPFFFILSQCIFYSSLFLCALLLCYSRPPLVPNGPKDPLVSAQLQTRLNFLLTDGGNYSVDDQEDHQRYCHR